MPLKIPASNLPFWKQAGYYRSFIMYVGAISLTFGPLFYFTLYPSGSKKAVKTTFADNSRSKF